MGYQSKTYSLSDEVVEAIESARERGLTPNQYFKELMGLDRREGTLDAVGLKVSDAMGKVTPTFRGPLLKPKQK